MRELGLIFVIYLCLINFLSAQSDTLIYMETDTAEHIQDNHISKKKNPKTASWLSAALPGAGQVYNEKYWKVPIVYGAIGTSLFQMSYNNKQYKRFLNAYIADTDTVKATINEFSDTRSLDNVIYYKDQFRRSRDLWAIGTIAFYLFNIMDASVDAHFSDFDISDDLSFYYRPELYSVNHKNLYGLTVGLYLK